MSDAELLTIELTQAGATIPEVVKIIDGYGDPIDWGDSELIDIIGEVWESDTNSGESLDNWIINEICRHFNVAEREE